MLVNFVQEHCLIGHVAHTLAIASAALLPGKTTHTFSLQTSFPGVGGTAVFIQEDPRQPNIMSMQPLSSVHAASTKLHVFPAPF